MRIEKEGKLKTSHLFSPRTFGSSRKLVARAVAGGGGAGAVGIRKDSRTRTGRLLLGEYLGLLLTSQPLLHGCLSYGVPHGADGQVRGVEKLVTVLRSYEVGGAEILDGDVVVVGIPYLGARNPHCPEYPLIYEILMGIPFTYLYR